MQQKNLAQRYDLADKSAPDVKMSRGKPVQAGPRTKLAQGLTWQQLAELSPEDIKAKEREIIAAQTADAKKPADIIAKMVEGKLRKFLNEITLLGQPFVKNPDITVEKLLKDSGATVTAFQRYAVGEGIEKQTGDFAAEVAAAAQAAK